MEEEKLVSTRAECIDPDIDQTVKNRYGNGNEMVITFHFPDGDWTGTFID